MQIDSQFVRDTNEVEGIDYLHLDRFDSVYEKIFSYKRERREGIFRCLSHGDINISNIILKSPGIFRVIDIDNICMGTPYFDRLFALVLFGANAGDFESSLSKPIFDAYGEGGAVEISDFVVTALYALGWYGFVRHVFLKNREEDQTQSIDALTHFGYGMQGLLTCYEAMIS